LFCGGIFPWAECKAQMEGDRDVPPRNYLDMPLNNYALSIWGPALKKILNLKKI
jgi:hypothetical protein